MTSIPTGGPFPASTGKKPITMFGPDFPFAYDDYVKHPADLGSIPAEHHGGEIAVIGGGCAGMVAAYELMKLGLKPVLYEGDQIGGRLKSRHFEGYEDAIAEMGAMRFPPSSTTLYHYFDLCGLETVPFPNPLAEPTLSTVIDLKGRSDYIERPEDLPQIYKDVMQAWSGVIQENADFAAMQKAICNRDVSRIKDIWNPLVSVLDDQTFYGFLSRSKEFASFDHREIFGQVGFGTGGWDTDYPNSMLEILRVVYTGADDDHRTVVGGVQRMPEILWAKKPETGPMAHWPAGTSLRDLNGGTTRPAAVRLYPTAPDNFTIVDSDGAIRTYPAVIVATQVWMLLSMIKCEETLFPSDVWTAIERTHYMQASKTFVIVDRPFWKDKDPDTGRHVMSMTLSDRMTRGTYLLDNGGDRPGVICLSYTWNDDSLKWLPMSPQERVKAMLESLCQIYPNVDIAKHIIADPISISWESEPWFMGAFKANLPGHYRYQRRLYTHFMQDRLPEHYRGIFLAGDDVSWTAGWAEGAVTTALNAVWGIIKHFGGTTDAENPGPGDVFDNIAPLDLDA